jgi:hypothetical protein
MTKPKHQKRLLLRNLGSYEYFFKSRRKMRRGGGGRGGERQEGGAGARRMLISTVALVIRFTPNMEVQLSGGK